jgi:hypothetical protein
MPAYAGLDGLVRNIGIMSRNNSVLSSMLSHLTAGDEPTEPRELRVLLQDTGLIARETGELLLSLQQSVGQESGPSADRQRSMLNKLNKDFQFVLKRFQQLAEQSAQHARTVDLEAARGSKHVGARGGAGGIAGSGAGAGADCYQRDDAEDEDPSAERNPLMASAQQQQQQQRRFALSAAEAMAERERMISQVETTVNEVKEIFSDLAVLVSNQSESIEHISSAIENTAQKTRRANEELLDANRYQAQARKRTCCLYAAGFAGLIILLMVLFVNFRL